MNAVNLPSSNEFFLDKHYSSVKNEFMREIKLVSTRNVTVIKQCKLSTSLSKETTTTTIDHHDHNYSTVHVNQVDLPVEQVDVPVEQVNVPVKQVNVPVKQVKEPAKQVYVAICKRKYISNGQSRNKPLEISAVKQLAVQSNDQLKLFQQGTSSHLPRNSATDSTVQKEPLVTNVQNGTSSQVPLKPSKAPPARRKQANLSLQSPPNETFKVTVEIRDLKWDFVMNGLGTQIFEGLAKALDGRSKELGRAISESSILNHGDKSQLPDEETTEGSPMSPIILSDETDDESSNIPQLLDDESSEIPQIVDDETDIASSQLLDETGIASSQLLDETGIASSQLLDDEPCIASPSLSSKESDNSVARAKHSIQLRVGRIIGPPKPIYKNFGGKVDYPRMCNVCQRSYKSRQSFCSHKKFCQLFLPNPIECTVCQRTFRRNDKFLKHQKHCSEGGKCTVRGITTPHIGLVACAICKKVFKFKETFDSHKKMFKKMRKCEDCNGMYVDQCSFNRHKPSCERCCEVKELQFNSMQECKTWMRDESEKHGYFITVGARTNKNKQKKFYSLRCRFRNRKEIRRWKYAVPLRRRCLLPNYQCHARMNLVVNTVDGRVFLKYFSKHSHPSVEKQLLFSKKIKFFSTT